MNYLLCLDVSTEAVHSDPQFGAAATVDTTWYGMHALVSPASSTKRMRKSNCLASSLPGMNQDPRTQHAFGAKADQERV